MRIWFPILILVTTVDISAQNIHDPFVGGLEIGLGYGTVIDFNLDNNRLSKDLWSARLFHLPIHAGFVASKFLNPNKYVEFGILYSAKNSSFVKYDFEGITLPALTLNCIDISVKYYSYIGKIGKQYMYVYGGLIPSWLIEPVQYYDDLEIPDNCFRNFLISICGGLCFDKKKSRLKLHTGLALTSVVNARYREIPQEDREYGGRIYPFELMFCYARMFR